MRSVHFGLFILSAVSVFVSAQDTKTIWIDELDISQVQAGWGSPHANRSIDGNPLTIDGKTYKRGLGTHARSVFNIDCCGNAVRFTAIAGLDDEVIQPNGARFGSIEFVVVGDNKPLWKSGVLKGNKPVKEVDVDITGVKVLSLIVTDVDDMNYDHADWAMAKIEYRGDKAPASIEVPRPKPYILTPKPGPKPRITGAKIFGVRPGNPFLFTVTATGQRPMLFEVKGLPDGLTIDEATGQIRGVVTKAGTYNTTVIAENALGRATRAFKIVVGDKICLTPPMGWNSWNCWGCAVDAVKVRSSAKAMADSGLINHGWSYINIDDCWMRKPGANLKEIAGDVRDSDGRILTNARFPDMKGLTDYIHDLGLKTGIYISPGPTTCQGFEGSWKHEGLDAQQFADWGFDYLKYDWCGYSRVSGNRTMEDLQRPYILMRQKLDEVKRDIVYSLCQYGWGDVWEWGGKVGGNCWRTTGDISDSWGSMSGIGFSQADKYPYAEPGQWNDPDMLVVGKVGWGPSLHDARLTPDEQYTHISLWCLLSSPLLIGCPIEQIDEFTMNLLTNDEVLDVNQDPLGRQARRVVKDGDVQVWAKDMEDGSKAVGLFNVSDFETMNIKLNFKDLGLSGTHSVRDLWRQKDLGTFSNSFTTADPVPVHGVVMIRVY